MKTIIFILSLAGASLAGAQSIDAADYALEQHQYEKARKLYSELAAKDGNKARYNYYIGNTYFYNTQYELAEKEYRKGITKEAGEPLNYVGLGLLELESNNVDGAKKQFDKALSLGKNAEVKTAISEAYANAYITQKLEFPITLIKEAIAEKATSHRHVILGNLYRLSGESGDGKKEYEKAIALDNKDPEPYLNLGQLWMKVNTTDAALSNYKKVQEIDPNYALVYRDLGEYYYTIGEVEKALDNYKKYISLVGNSISERLRFAAFLYANSRYEESIQQLEAVEQVDSSNVYLLNLMAYAYHDADQNDKGIIAARRFFNHVKPERITTKDYIIYGDLLAADDQDSLAILQYTKAAEKDSNNPVLYENISQVYFQNKNYLEAAKALEKKMAVDKRTTRINPQDYFTAGRYYYQSEKMKKADSLFVLTTEAYPDYIYGFVYRARANATLDPDLKSDTTLKLYAQVADKAMVDKEANKTVLVEAYRYTASYYYQKENYKEVERVAKQIKELEPDNAFADQLLDYLRKRREALRQQGSSN